MGCGASVGPRQNLERCLDSGPEGELTKALEEVKGTPDNDGASPHLIKLAEQRVDKLAAQKEAEQGLSVATGEQDISINALESAIEVAVKADLGESADCGKAKVRLAALRAQEAASAKLEFAMGFKDLGVLRKAISEAGGIENVDLSKAKARLVELRAIMRQDLASSTSWHIGALTTAIQQATYSGAEEDDAEGLAAAKAKLAELWAVERDATVEELEAVVSSEDIPSISAAIARGERAGGMGEPLEKAVARRRELLHREAVADLDNALAEGSRSRLEEAISHSERVALEGSEPALEAARKALEKLIRRDEAMAALEDVRDNATGWGRADKLSLAILEAELAHVDSGVLEEYRSKLEEWRKPVFLQAPSGDCQDGEWQQLDDKEQEILKGLIEDYEMSQGTANNLDMGDGVFVNFNLMTISRPKKDAGKDKLMIMPLKQQDSSGAQIKPEPGALHPWYEHLIEKKDQEREGDWLTNAWFWQAFSDCLRKQGHEVPETPHDFFDFRYNVDYRDWQGPEKETRGGVVYNYPKGWKRFAVRVKNRFGVDNAWLRLDGNPEEWAVAYHGTTYEALVPILEGGLKAGRAQVYRDKKDARTGQNIGTGIYCTPSMSVAQAYASSRTGEGQFSLDGKSALFVVTCRIKPSAIKRCQDENKDSGAYWVINDKDDIRPYGVLVKEAPKK